MVEIERKHIEVDGVTYVEVDVKPSAGFVKAHLERHAGHYLAGLWFGGEGTISALEHSGPLQYTQLGIVALGIGFIIAQCRSN